MEKSEKEKIDFVITWVDGSDPRWQAERNKYSYDNNREARYPIRYRDWNNLQYLFRGIEKYAPWVNNVFLVTSGQVPMWLNTKNPKLKLIKHSDFMPAEYLPTFSSQSIELNFHRIKELSEQFVYFNDDMFIIKETKPEDFFINGKPCETAALVPIPPSGHDKLFFETLFNNTSLINKNFQKKIQWPRIKNKFHKLSNKGLLFRTLICEKSYYFLGFKYLHLPTSLLKSTYEKIWDMEFTELDNSSRHKFRTHGDYNQYLFKDWQIAEGNFHPRNPKIGKWINVEDNNIFVLKDIIEKQKYKLICINDTDYVSNFKMTRNSVNESLAKIFSEKSKFEI